MTDKILVEALVGERLDTLFKKIAKAVNELNMGGHVVKTIIITQGEPVNFVIMPAVKWE